MSVWKKPWEQTWTGPIENEWVARDVETGLNRLHVYNDTMTKEESDEVVRFASAAPDMARALLMWLPEDGHTQECGSRRRDEQACSLECSTTRIALRKAGVPL